MTHDRRAAELERRRAEALAGGGKERVAKLHAQGRLSARERIALLIDPGTFQELGVFVTHRSDDPTIHDRKITGDGVVDHHDVHEALSGLHDFHVDEPTPEHHEPVDHHEPVGHAEHHPHHDTHELFGFLDGT